MRRLLLVMVSLMAVTTAGCTSADPAVEDPIAGKDAVQLINELDRLAVEERPADLMASVRPDELVLTDADGAERTLDLPDDRFYLSVAPYVSTTHECFHHSLTTCKGELSDEKVQVTVTDDTGKVLVEKQTRTFDNGFVGLWLRRGATGTVEVEHDGKQGQARFGTGQDDPTCLTTLQLT